MISRRLFLVGLAVAAYSCSTAETACGQSRPSPILPQASILFAHRESVLSFGSQQTTGESSTGTRKRYGREGLIIGLAIGTAFCLSDLPEVKSCNYKIPLGGILGFTFGHWIIAEKVDPPAE